MHRVFDEFSRQTGSLRYIGNHPEKGTKIYRHADGTYFGETTSLVDGRKLYTEIAERFVPGSLKRPE
ncbi:MAG: hypothetical protein HYY37_00765 [Candidatus Aenigmarchaeota archaeon]|nr:hypothetical protein [Candidatus Aenigmarchaeota archaeon]